MMISLDDVVYCMNVLYSCLPLIRVVVGLPLPFKLKVWFIRGLLVVYGFPLRWLL